MNTMTEEIPREEWGPFLNLFSQQHRGWITTLEIMGTEFGAQAGAERMRFEGATYESHSGHDEAIRIMIGDSPKAHMTHSIAKPTHVRLATSQLDSGTFETLEIESDGGQPTLVRFHAGVEPEKIP